MGLAIRAGDLGARGDALGTRPARSRVVHVIEHPGAAPGPWNIHTQPLRKSHDGRLFFGGRPLVAYHYSSLKPGQLADPHYAITAEQERLIYAPYLKALRRTELGTGDEWK